MVKETLLTPDSNTILKEETTMFLKKNMFDNKVDARLFFDDKFNELEELFVCQQTEETSNKIKLELYLTIDGNINNGQCFLLLSTIEGEHLKHKMMENQILKFLADEESRIIKSKTPVITTKNSYLDSHYKD